MSKEIRLGGLDEFDSPNWAIFDNVIHIPEDEDIAVVYGPNRSGKSTMLRAIAGTMDLFRGSRKGWDDANIGLIPPYKVEFIDESNLSDNVIYTTNFRQPWVDWQEMPLDELIDWLQEKANQPRNKPHLDIYFDKRCLWACNVLMVEPAYAGTLSKSLPTGVDWIHYRIDGESGKEWIFIDLRRARIKMTSTLEVSFDYDLNAPGPPELKVGGLSWPMFWPDGSPGWLKADYTLDDGNPEEVVDDDLMRRILWNYGLNIPRGVYEHLARNPKPEEGKATRDIWLDAIFDKNPFAEGPLLESLGEEKPIEKRKKSELVAILRSLDNTLQASQKAGIYLGQWAPQGLFKHPIGRTSGTKDDLIGEIGPRFRAVAMLFAHSELDKATNFHDPYYQTHRWKVKSEIILPDTSEQESREIIQGMLGVMTPEQEFEELDLLGAIGGDEVPKTPGPLETHLRSRSELDDDAMHSLFMELKEILPHEVEFNNINSHFKNSGFDGPFLQNGFITIYDSMLTFASRSHHIWAETLTSHNGSYSISPAPTTSLPGMTRRGPREVPYPQDHPVCLRLDVDRVSGYRIQTSSDSGESKRPTKDSGEASFGLDSKLDSFIQALPSVEEVTIITDAMNNLISHAQTKSKRSGGKKWSIVVAEINQYTDYDVFCYPKYLGDDVLLPDKVKRAAGLSDQGVMESHHGIVNRIEAVYSRIEEGWGFEVDERGMGRDSHTLRVKPEWGDYGGLEEIDIIRDFENLVNKLSCALTIIRAAKDITGIGLEIDKDLNWFWNVEGGREPDLSSGEKHIFAILVPIATEVLENWGSEGDVLVMIDEPEVSLHVKWQRELYAAIDSILREIRPIEGSSRIKVVLATHSPEFIGAHEGGSQRLGPKEEDYGI